MWVVRTVAPLPCFSTRASLCVCRRRRAGARRGAAGARYGPFWIATTLVFLSAVAGNYASYVSYRRTHAAAASGSDVPAWYYDVDKARARGRRPAPARLCVLEKLGTQRGAKARRVCP
jgi:hypothetical protein